jgi:predicted nuclease with TOPRIM domain
MTEQEQLTRILTLVEQFDRDLKETNKRSEETNKRLEETNKRLEETNKRLEEEVKRWDERFFQLVKEQGATARTIIIAAASVVVLSPVLGAVVDLAARFLPLLPQG